MVESYDPDNKDDIFAGLETRIEECKYTYEVLKTNFDKKHRICPASCPICCEDFQGH
jgi:hypothetical protein